MLRRKDVYDWHNFLGNPVFLDAANVRYIVSGAEFQDPRLREVHRGSALVYENLGALPRAWLVPNVVATNGADGALEIMKQEGFDPRATAVVNTPNPVRLPAGSLEGTVQVAEYLPDRVVIRTRQNREALLVLADNFYEGWQARIDGTRVPVLRTNHTFRGVVVGPGEHEVIFSFEPKQLYTGFLVYCVGLALLAVYGLFLPVRHLRRRDCERWRERGGSSPPRSSAPIFSSGRDIPKHRPALQDRRGRSGRFFVGIALACLLVEWLLKVPAAVWDGVSSDDARKKFVFAKLSDTSQDSAVPRQPRSSDQPQGCPRPAIVTSLLVQMGFLLLFRRSGDLPSPDRPRW